MRTIEVEIPDATGPVLVAEQECPKCGAILMNSIKLVEGADCQICERVKARLQSPTATLPIAQAVGVTTFKGPVGAPQL